jgi:hypothetical protein
MPISEQNQAAPSHCLENLGPNPTLVSTSRPDSGLATVTTSAPLRLSVLPGLRLPWRLPRGRRLPWRRAIPVTTVVPGIRIAVVVVVADAPIPVEAPAWVPKIPGAPVIRGEGTGLGLSGSRRDPKPANPIPAVTSAVVANPASVFVTHLNVPDAAH